MNASALACDLPVAHSRRLVAASSIVEAFRAPDCNFPHSRRATRVQKLGLQFERRVMRGLTHAGHRLDQQPHFRFHLAGGSRESCFPDALLRASDSLVIIECKLKHTYDAYVQLTRLYLPVLSKVYTDRRLRRLEVCKNYDPSVTLPEPATLLQRSGLDEWLAVGSDYGVLVWGR